jgi:hypothetical protein
MTDRRILAQRRKGRMNVAAANSESMRRNKK